MFYRLLVILFLSVLSFVPRGVYAQDMTSYWALDDDYNRLKRVLENRAVVEHANELLHKYSKDANVEYKDINEALDKYSKWFDIIDIIITSGTTIINVKNTYDDVKDRLEQIGILINKFKDECALKGNIISSDTIIINACVSCVEKCADDGEELVKSFKQLALYVSGKIDCKSETLLLILNNVNKSLDRIKETIDHTYYVLWKYITIRTHYWKKELWRAKSLQEMANDAFSRWKWAAGQVGY